MPVTEQGRYQEGCASKMALTVSRLSSAPVALIVQISRCCSIAATPSSLKFGDECRSLWKTIQSPSRDHFPWFVRPAS